MSLDLQCTSCGKPLSGDFIDSARNEQRVVVYRDHDETQIDDSEEFGTWCMSCGLGAAVSTFAARGLQLHKSTAGRLRCACARGCGREVDETAQHVAYTVLQSFVDGDSLEVVADFYCSPVCTSCEPPKPRTGQQRVMEQFGPLDVAQFMKGQGRADE